MAQKRTLTDGQLGGYQIDRADLAVGAHGHLGAYRLSRSQAGRPVGSVSFLVEEVVPARIEV